MQNKEHSDTKIVLIKFIALDLLELVMEQLITYWFTYLILWADLEMYAAAV